MSEVKRWRLKGFLPGVEGECKAVFQPTVVMAEDFDRVTAELASANSDKDAYAQNAIDLRKHVDALQALLTAADEQIDLLSPRPTEQPEGKRERFEKWVMATKHPVYGFLDGRSLARGDDRTGYADEYVQGLWVAYLAFGAEQLAPVPVVPELTSELRWILGQMCFQHIHTAQALRLMGHQIARKAEDEQAVTIYWMLGHYLKDPENWRENATAEMKAAAPAA